MLSRLVFPVLCATWVSAHPTDSFKTCKDYVLPVTVTSTNYVWGLPTIETNYDIATFTTNLAAWDSNVTWHPISGITPNVTASYKIAGTFCTPTTGDSKTVLLASHGVGFDRRWDPSL